MYYKVLRACETGTKFQVIAEKMDECTKQITALSEKYGFKRWRHANFEVWGGLSAVLFAENEDEEFLHRPDKSVWTEVRGGYWPKRNIAQGKQMHKEFRELLTVSMKDLNAVVDYKPDSPWSHIGFSFRDPQYFLFSTSDGIPFKAPYDCVEILFSEYETLSKSI